MIKNHYILLGILSIIALIILYIIGAYNYEGMSFDFDCWSRWAWFAKENGLSNIYQSDSNYYPLYHYFLWGFALFYDSFDSLIQHLWLMRLLSFGFDIFGVYLVYLLINKKSNFVSLLLFSLLNVGFYYNSLIWGQIDGIMSFFIFASFYALWKKNLIAGSVLISIAVAFKFQSVVFLPVFGLLLFIKYPKNEWLKKTLIGIGLFAATFAIISLPFILTKNNALLYWNVLTGLVDYHPYVTMGAANFWKLVFPSLTDWIVLDSDLVLGIISYKQIGLSLFFISSFFSLFPLIKIVCSKLKGNEKVSDLSLETFLLSACLVGLSFFLFNTQIHERYSHPVFLFLMAYSFLKKEFLPYIIFSFAYLVNLEKICLAAGPYANSFFFLKTPFLTLMYLYVYISLMVKMYKGIKTQENFSILSKVK